MTDDTVAACPHCDHANATWLPSQGRWYCDACGEHFAEPVRRERRSHGGSTAEYADWTLTDVDLGRGEADE